MNLYTPPDAFVEDDQNYRRFWVLALLAGVERAGLSPIDLKLFNLLSYFANAIAKCYDLEPLNPIVLKQKNGILYPKLIWDLDRLVGMQLVKISNLVINYESKSNAKFASYSISESGIKCLNDIKNISIELDAIGNNLSNIALAFCRAKKTITTENLLEKDANLSDSKFAEGDVVDFGKWDKYYNATASSVNFIKNNIQNSALSNIETAINLYARYISALNN